MYVHFCLGVRSSDGAPLSRPSLSAAVASGYWSATAPSVRCSVQHQQHRALDAQASPFLVVQKSSSSSLRPFICIIPVDALSSLYTLGSLCTAAHCAPLPALTENRYGSNDRNGSFFFFFHEVQVLSFLSVFLYVCLNSLLHSDLKCKKAPGRSRLLARVLGFHSSAGCYTHASYLNTERGALLKVWAFITRQSEAFLLFKTLHDWVGRGGPWCVFVRILDMRCCRQRERGNRQENKTNRIIWEKAAAGCCSQHKKMKSSLGQGNNSQPSWFI